MAAPQASSRLEMLQDLSRQTQGQRRPEELRNRKEMHIRSQQLGARPGVSMDMKTSWAAQEYDSTFPNLEIMARFQQKQLQEKEQKLLQLYDQQQQRAYQVVQRGSAGSNGSHHGSTAVRTTTTTTSSSSSHSTSTSQGGKVRQMFDERRQTTVKGIDRSYPLEPLENKLRKQANGVAPQRNGNVTVNRQSVKRVTRADVNSNVNGGKPVVSYHEEIIRDSFGPSVRRHDDEDEYGVENRVATFANGYHRHEIDNEQEEAFDQDTIERNRMMAKIHLMGFDETLKHRVRNDLDSEEFPEYLMTDVPDKLSKRNVTKKLSQAEERLERFKNTNAKRGNVPKQSGTVIRKRPEQTTKSNSRLRSAGTSPTSTRSESSRISERSQRILENAKSLDTEMLSQRTNPRSFSTREAIKTETTSKFYPRNNEFKSLTSDGKLIVRRSASPQFFCRESERSATTMSIDRKSGSSGSPLFHREMLTKRNRSPRFFLNEYEQSRRTSESKSPIWGDTGILSKPSTSPQYFHYDSKRSETAMSSDRETTGSKAWSKGILTKRDMTDFKQKKVQTSTSFDRQSPPFKSSQYEDNILKRRSTSPQFFCKESERSATTMSIDRATSESKSPSYDREIITKRGASPRFFLNKSDRETVGSKASEWNKGILTKRGMTDFEQKKIGASINIDRQSSPFKSSLYEDELLKKRSTSPQFFCKESERSATTMSIDRATSESKSPSHDREIVTKRPVSPFFLNQETVGFRAPDWSKGILTKRDMTDFEQKKVRTSTNIDRQSSRFKSPLYEDKKLKKRSTSPQFFCKESERSATTMSIDRATSESKSPSYDREIMTKRGASSPFFLSESKQARRTSKSPIWSDVSSKQSTSMQYFLHKPKQFETAMSIDREIVGSKSSELSKGILTKRDMTDIEQKKIQTNTGLNRQTSPVKSSLYEDKILKRRSTSPQFFCKESERSATTMSIDRATSGSKSPSQDRETLTRRGASPPFFFSESEQSRRTSESKSSIWSDRGILSRQSTSPRYREFKRSETAMSTDRETIESKSSEWSKRNTRPRFFYNSLGRSGTTMSTGRKICEPKSSPYDRKILTKRSSSPLFNGKTEQRSAIARRVDRKNDGFKLSGITRDKRSTSPQFFCKESERSATTMLIEPRSRHTRRTDSTKNVLKQRDYISDTSYRRSVKSPIDRKVISTKYRYTPSPPTRHEVKRVSGKNEFSKNITEARRSSRISETSATSASSIVNLKYGLELDNIFQSTGLVRKFMKSQNGKQRATRQSPSKRNITEVNARIAARGNQSKNRRKTSPLLQTTRSPSIEDRKRATPEFSRKTITPTEVDMDIQEITMTDHRIERDKLQKASSPISKRQFDGAYAKSPGSRAKFKTSITYPVHKMRRQSESTLESSAFKGGPFKKRSDQEGEESVISKFSPASESSLVTRGGREENRMFFQTQKQSARNQAKHNATQSMKYEDRQRASSRSPNQMWTRSAKSRTGNPRAISPKNTASPILYNFAERTKGACTKFDQPRSLRSTLLVQDAAKDRNLSTDDEYSRGREGDKNKDIGVDEVDARIDVKCQTIVETALDEKIKDQRKIARPNSADRIANRKVFLRETTQKPMKSSTSKKTISPTRDCGRRHDVKFRVSPRLLRKTAEISRDAYTPKIFLSRSIVSKADQSSTPKSSAVKDRKYESVLVAKRLAESFDKMKVKCKTEESEDSVEEFTKVLRENKYEKNLERMDSVESALRRFDSIGAEFERSSPTNLRASPEISLQTIDIQTEASKQSIVPEGTTIPSREVTDHTILRSMLKSPIGKDLKAKNAAYKSDLRIHQKKTRSFKRPMKVESFIESKQRTTKIRSPTCKRRLFESDSEKEIQEEWLKSNRIKARKDENCPFVNFRFRKDEAVSNVRSKDFHLDITRKSMRSEETLVKPLRSIEDIRKSIENERNKLITVEESRSAIANRRSASRDGVDAKKSSPATNAARNVFLGADPARAIKIRSCVSRITKSPSPDSAAIKQRETNARTTKGSNPSSPSKSPEVAARRTDLRNQEAKPSKRSTVAKGMDSTGSKMTTAGAVDTTDGALQNGSPSEFTTRKSDAFTMDFDDRPSKEDDAMPLKKSSMKKYNDKQQTASSASGRPTSSSNSSVNLIQDSSAKGRMAENERGKGTGKGGGKSKGKGIEKPSSSGKLANASSFNEDATTDTKGLVKCKTCGRSFASNRIDRHEEICTKTTTKKRKQFDPVLSRVKGTELEPFVKKSISKRETKTKKPETKPDWRRKHEEFINTIRYARETQARLAAGENLSDLPPPPTSDTSDYIQCEHCGRKFNQSAAERHIPICKRMHNKKQTPKARR